MTSLAVNNYEYDLNVVNNEIDDQGRVNNAVYLKWVQDAVVHQWKRLAPRDAIAAHLWVALKHEIRYLHPAFLNDHIEIQVLLEKLQGARAIIKTLIERNGEVLAIAESCWCCLDATTQRPARLARDVVMKFLPNKQTNAD